jgi:hypothetical protein
MKEEEEMVVVIMKSFTGCCPLEDLSKGLYALLPLPLSRILYSILLFIIQRCFCVNLYKINYPPPPRSRRSQGVHPTPRITRLRRPRGPPYNSVGSITSSAAKVLVGRTAPASAGFSALLLLAHHRTTAPSSHPATTATTTLPRPNG